MDILVESKPVTHRSGYAVEINALWYNALRFADELGTKFGDRGRDLGALAERCAATFNELFWDERLGCLGDFYRNGRLDLSIRPNQVFAVSLPYAVLHPSRWKTVVEKVARELLTPVGLRTLSPGDPAYQGRYGGGPVQRDRAYHQGTVWPWLFGAYGEAALKAADGREKTKKNLLAMLKRFLDNHLSVAGIGFISEVFNGDPPHEPNGCIAQAWNSAEIIRLWTLLNEKPKTELPGGR